MKRILITGGSGFIGSNLVRLLLSAGHELLNFDKLTYAAVPASLDEFKQHPRYRFLQADLADASAIRSAITDFRPHAIIHLAAESHVDRSIDSPANFIQSNIVGTFNLLEAARSYTANHRSGDSDPAFRVLHVSTDEVFGSAAPNSSFTEQTAYDPHSPYSATKAAADHLARAWFSTYRLPLIVTNCSNNYGPYQYPEKLIPLTILTAIHDQPIPVYGSGENVRDWIHVEDHCRGLVAVLERGRVGETYNIGAGSPKRNIDVVHAICRVLDNVRPRADGKPYSDQIQFVTDRPGHDERYAIDNTKIRTELQWAPQTDFETGLTKTVTWYLENQSWWQPLLSSTNPFPRQGQLTSSSTP